MAPKSLLKVGTLAERNFLRQKNKYNLFPWITWAQTTGVRAPGSCRSDATLMQNNPAVSSPAGSVSFRGGQRTNTNHNLSLRAERAFRVKQRAKPTVKSAVWNRIISADPQSAERPRDKSGEWNKTQIGAMATWPLLSGANKQPGAETWRAECQLNDFLMHFSTATDGLAPSTAFCSHRCEDRNDNVNVSSDTDEETMRRKQKKRAVRSCFQLVCQTHPVSPGSEPVSCVNDTTWCGSNGLYSYIMIALVCPGGLNSDLGLTLLKLSRFLCVNSALSPLFLKYKWNSGEKKKHEGAKINTL